MSNKLFLWENFNKKGLKNNTFLWILCQKIIIFTIVFQKIMIHIKIKMKNREYKYLTYNNNNWILFLLIKSQSQKHYKYNK